MNSFTFVTLSYNQENEIREHLESIMRIIIKYGEGINISYVLCDDCSTDKTVEIVKDWINMNPIFGNVKIEKNDRNIGTVRNYIKAISMVDTEDFKLLAGDDKYGLFNIFQLFDKLGDSLLCTPVTLFGNVDYNRVKSMESDFRLLMFLNKKGYASDSICVKNLMPAPGVFYKLDLVKDKKLIIFLQQFQYIEDYPLFYYLIHIKNIKMLVDNQSYIYYRVGSGISTNISSSFYNGYLNDQKSIMEIIRPKFDILPKYINPYRYYMKFLRIIIERKKDEFPIFYLESNPKEYTQCK